MSAATVLRSALLYLFLIFITRVVGRRPGKQITPFEFVLIFYLGGLCLTAMVALEASVTNAFAQIACIALTHYLITHARSASPRVARLLDGTPLILMEGKTWRAETMRRMRIGDADVMNMARDQGLKTLDDIDTATLERNGEISIIPAEDEEEDSGNKEEDGSASTSTASNSMESRQAGNPMANKEEEANKPRAVGDSVPKVDNAVAVGESLEFQRRWWRFENAVWWLFAAVLVADVLGLLGAGPLAHAHASTPDGSFTVKYDRIERATTPVALTVQPGPQAVQSGRAVLFVSDSVIKELGAQRIAPQPAVSAPGNGGVTYLFPITGPTSTIEFGLQPSAIGLHHIRIGTPQGQQIDRRVLVLP